MEDFPPSSFFPSLDPLCVMLTAFLSVVKQFPLLVVKEVLTLFSPSLEIEEGGKSKKERGTLLAFIPVLGQKNMEHSKPTYVQ